MIEMIIFIVFLFATDSDASPSTYECGLHGRFEYCIDGFAGCVVGCHCYPGYYFDTDSKICEPNTKLTQDFRRNLPSPSYPNLPMGMGVGGTHMPAPAPFDSGTADAQENGDISDWLYNQFFKTIETGVINKTDEDDFRATRRSGVALAPNILRKYRKRKSRYGRKRGSRKKTRLRASSDSSDASDSSSSSSSSDSSSNLGSWERFEWSPRPNQPGQKEDAAQRQIVVYSKKPKPPLPSFIFLPNMQTPFFPPIGLPAPAMPLYPMVPVPPIQPKPDCTEHDPVTPTATTLETTRTTASGISEATTTLTTTAATTTPTPEPEIHVPEDSTPAPERKALRFRSNRPKDRKAYKKPPKDLFNQYQDGESDAMFLGDTNLPYIPFTEDDMKMDKAEEPDFKYISQLIHRDFNETTTTQTPWQGFNFNRQPTPHIDVISPGPYMSKKRQKIMPGRLNDMTRRQMSPKNNEQDDSYFSTLGRQIAKLIRGIQTENDGKDETKFDPAKDMKGLHPFFAENTFAARSYWERFVRSPLIVRLNNFTEYGNVIAGNEQLFDLENKVQEATSPPPLDLLQLENVINTMQTMHSQINNKKLKDNNNTSNRSLNFSLLPKVNNIKLEQQQKSKIERNDHLFAHNTARMVANDFRNSNSKQKSIAIIPDKPKLSIEKESSKWNNKNNRHVGAATINVGAYAHMQRRKPYRSATMTPISNNMVPSVKTAQKSERGLIKLNKVKQHFFNQRRLRNDRIIFVSGSDYVHSNRYFFEPNMNLQSENWSS